MLCCPPPPLGRGPGQCRLHLPSHGFASPSDPLEHGPGGWLQPAVWDEGEQEAESGIPGALGPSTTASTAAVDRRRRALVWNRPPASWCTAGSPALPPPCRASAWKCVPGVVNGGNVSFGNGVWGESASIVLLTRTKRATAEIQTCAAAQTQYGTRNRR